MKTETITIKFQLNLNSKTTLNKQELMNLFNKMVFEDETIKEWEEIIDSA